MEYEIYHHGVKGQKWGVRRYQNKDGTLTDAGKKRASNKDIREYKKQVSKEIEGGHANERAAIRAEREKADQEYKEYVKKHGLLEDDTTDEYWDDYEKRPDVYDKALSIYDKVYDREYKLDTAEGKQVADRLVERFGQERMDRFQRSDRTKTLVAVGAVAIPLAVMSLPMAAVTIPIVAVAALATSKSNKANKQSKPANTD